MAHQNVPIQEVMKNRNASPEVIPVSVPTYVLARRDRVVVRPLSRVAGEPMVLALPGLLL